jgi:hypothetical protein
MVPWGITTVGAALTQLEVHDEIKPSHKAVSKEAENLIFHTF